jgi:hypothetical protein
VRSARAWAGVAEETACALARTMENANAPHERKHHHHHHNFTATDLAEQSYTRNFSRERLQIRRLVRHSYFSTFIYFVIGVNTVLIAFDDISKNSQKYSL